MNNYSAHIAYHSKSSVNILIVEDDVLSAHVASRFLVDLGCEVYCVKDDKEALAFFENSQQTIAYDLIFMDISLSGMDGYTLVQKIQKTRNFIERPVPIVALTAYGDEKSKRRCLEVGMCAVLVKPLLKTTALEILKAFIPHWDQKDSTIEPRVDNQSTPIDQHAEDVIDFSHVLQVYDNDVAFVKSALQVVLDSLDADLKQLEYECNIENWSAARVIIHRLQGGIRYFDLKRLDEVCKKFTYILHHAPDAHWVSIFEVLSTEVERVRKACEQWLENQAT